MNASEKKSLFGVILIVAAAISARADQLDDYIKAEMDKQHIPGLSLAIVRDGKVVRAQGYGLANVELSVPATAETVYRIASLSKQFIASGIMLLVEEGKVSLDDRVGKYLEGTPETWREIAVRHLLSHTSGLARESPGIDGPRISFLLFDAKGVSGIACLQHPRKESSREKSVDSISRLHFARVGSCEFPDPTS